MNEKTTRGGTAEVMGDIDAHASPSGPSSPANPDNASKFIKHAIYGSETPKQHISGGAGTSQGTHAGFGDQTAQHVKMSHEKKMHVRSTAMNQDTWTGDNELPHYQHGDPEY